MRKPKIELYWTKDHNIASLDNDGPLHVINWRLIGGNGEVMCQSTQGFRDKTDAMRSIDAVAHILFNYPLGLKSSARVTGPGRKPK